MTETITPKKYDEVPAAYQVPYVWLDGKIVPAAEATLPLMTHTLHYGVGVFEGVRSYETKQGGAIFRLPEHVERLCSSAHLMRMDMPWSKEEIARACVEALRANKMASGYLRPIAFIDDGKRGLGAVNNRTRLAVVVWPWGTYLGEEGLKRGIRAQIASGARTSQLSFMPRGKICGQYVNSVIAKRTALLSGYDEAIMLDDAGNVAEATGENIFVVKNGVLRTPPLSSPILPGITRDTILQLAASIGIPCREETFGKETLLNADEVFFTGTAAEVTPVRDIDSYRIGTGARGPITEQLQSLYFAAVRGEVAAWSSWLTTYQLDV